VGVSAVLQSRLPLSRWVTRNAMTSAHGRLERNRTSLPLLMLIHWATVLHVACIRFTLRPGFAILYYEEKTCVTTITRDCSAAIVWREICDLAQCSLFPPVSTSKHLQKLQLLSLFSASIGEQQVPRVRATPPTTSTPRGTEHHQASACQHQL
jgi:hypothetical protein